MQEHRDKLLKQRRKQTLQKLLRRERQKLHENCRQQTQSKFEQIYPIVDQTNYDTHKYDLAYMVEDERYRYQISVFASLIHDYVIEHRSDSPSVKILTFISEFQDIAIPQTHEFARFLTELSETRVTDSLIICANLLSLQRYQNLLRDRLNQCNYLETVERMADSVRSNKQEHQMVLEMISEIYCSMIASQPLLPLPAISETVAKLRKLTFVQEVKWNIVHMFSQIRRRIKPHKRYAQTMLSEFEDFVLSQKHGNELHIFDLLVYCAHSSVFSHNRRVLQFIANSLLTHNLPKMGWFGSALECLLLYEQELEIDLSCDQIVSLLHSFVDDSTQMSAKQDILSILNYVSEQDVLEAVETVEFRDQFVEKTMQCIGHTQTFEKVLHFLMRVFASQDIGLKQQFDSYGCKRVLQRAYEQRSAEYGQQIQELLRYF